MQVRRLNSWVSTYRCGLITIVECQPSRLRQGYTNKWDTWGLRLSPACVNTESQSAQDVLVLAFYSHGNKL